MEDESKNVSEEIVNDENATEENVGNVSEEDVSEKAAEAEITEDADENAEDDEKAEEVGAFAGELPDAGFEETVEDLDVSKIKPSFDGKKASVINANFIIRMLILIVCASLFMYCVYSIAMRIADDTKSREMMEELIETVEQKSAVARISKVRMSPTSLGLYDSLGVTEQNEEWNDVTTTGEYDTYLNTLSELKKKNPDIYAWILCKGGLGQINYPVVLAPDNDFYLHRDINKEYAVAGSIFTDFRNSRKVSDNLNTVIYGHCMMNGTMFRSIKNWMESSTRNSSADLITVELITEEAVYVYEVFSAYRSDGNHFITISFPNTDGYLDFLHEIQRKSVLSAKHPYDENTRILTLCTCTNVSTNSDERYVLHCKLKKIIKYN